MPSLPDSVAHLSWRPATVADAEALASLHEACYEADGGTLMVASEYRDSLTHPANDAASDSIVAVGGDGRLAAFGLVPVIRGEWTKHRAFPWGNVHPALRRRGIGTALLRWLEQRAIERLGGFDDGRRRIIRLDAYDHQSDRIELFERFGYEPSRYWIEMIRDLTDPFPEVPRLQGIAIYGWSDVTRAAALEVHNQAFADHWGSEPITPESWDHGFDEFFLPEASCVAYDGDVPVAYLVSSMFPHDFEPRGRTEAWIEGLGTIRSHRGRGIAAALIQEAMARFRDRDLEYAALGADAENLTGAVGLYERLGFTVEQTSITFAKWLD